MISKRFPRHSSAQESLRQFALNCSKGVDETTPITDSDTVLYTKNLVRNPDGSVSIRKPIKQLPMKHVFEKIYPLHEPEYYLGVVDGHLVGIFKGDDPVPVKVKATNYFNVELSVDCELINTALFTELEVLALNTTTVVGCLVDFKLFRELFENDPGNVLNPDLYDAPDSPHYRYVQIQYDTSVETWTLTIKTPEVNVLNISEGEVPLNPNLVLDNPYAIRDEYGASLPTVKSIVAYVPTKLDGKSPTVHTVPETSVVYRGFLSRQVETDTFEQFEDPKSYPRRGEKTITLSTPVKNDAGDTINVQVKLFLEFAFVKYVTTNYTFQYTLHSDVQLNVDVPITDTSFKATVNREVYSRRLNSDYTYQERKDTFEMSDSGSDTTLSLVYNAPLSNVAGSPILSLFTTYLIKLELVVNNVAYTGNTTVSDVTESVKGSRFRPVVAFSKDAVPTILKAFCSAPSKDSKTTFYGAWYRSSDGAHWNGIRVPRASEIIVRDLYNDYEYDPEDNSENAVKPQYASVYYYPLNAESEKDFIYLDNEHYRTDVAVFSAMSDFLQYRYMFKIVSVVEISETLNPNEYDSELSGTQFLVDVEYGRAVYTPVVKDSFEFLDTFLGNGASGKKLYYKRSIYSYGNEKFENNILATDIDSFITPLYKIIDVDTVATPKVTTLTPWRDYLISATDRSVHLHQKLSEGYTTKVLTTSVGIPEADSKCCVSVLNSIIFKSHSKIYRMYPGAYSSDDTVLNITDISAPIESILYDIGETENNFAFSTSTEYILMMPYENGTHCLRYDYADRVWTYCEYPVVFDSYRVNNLEDIRLYGYVDAGYIGKSLIKSKKYVEFMFDYRPSADEAYADILETGNVPINFEYDTGQKTDSISRTKQFVESKLVFATLDEKDSFPFTLQVAIDGDPHVTTKDVSTDAPFWKTDNSIGVVGTAFRLTSSTEGAAGIFNTLRQLVVRYSGKGKSIRHRIVGESVCNFKLYETYVRYKNLSGK